MHANENGKPVLWAHKGRSDSVQPRDVKKTSEFESKSSPSAMYASEKQTSVEKNLKNLNCGLVSKLAETAARCEATTHCRHTASLKHCREDVMTLAAGCDHVATWMCRIESTA